MFDTERVITVRISKQFYDYLKTFPTMTEGVRIIIEEAMIKDGLTPRKLKLSDVEAKRLYKRLAKAGYEEILS